MTPTQYSVLEWLANGRAGLSSKTVAFYLGFGIVMERGCNYPHDPADFGRCLVLLGVAPALKSDLPRMAELSPIWAGLVVRWDEIEQSFLSEVGLGWTKAREAPITYDLMRSILDELERRP